MGRGLLLGALGAVAAYGLVLRPRLITWGATHNELREAFPGGGLVPGGERAATLAATVDAPPHAVWPELVRLVARRCPGDGVALAEPPRCLLVHGVRDVRGRALDPAQPRPPAHLERVWGARLVELPGGRTRLLLSGYQAARPRWLGRLLLGGLLPPVVWAGRVRLLAELRSAVGQPAEPARRAR